MNDDDDEGKMTRNFPDRNNGQECTIIGKTRVRRSSKVNQCKYLFRSGQPLGCCGDQRTRCGGAEPATPEIRPRIPSVFLNAQKEAGSEGGGRRAAGLYKTLGGRRPPQSLSGEPPVPRTSSPATRALSIEHLLN